jgi:hypothetical protein
VEPTIWSFRIPSELFFEASYVLAAQYQFVQVICDASNNWWIIGAGTA